MQQTSNQGLRPLQQLVTQIVTPLPPKTCHTILCGQTTGAWLTSMPSLYHGTELSAQEFCDALFLQYAHSPQISLLTVMAVATSSLCIMVLLVLLVVLAYHNELHDELANACSPCFHPQCCAR